MSGGSVERLQGFRVAPRIGLDGEIRHALVVREAHEPHGDWVSHHPDNRTSYFAEACKPGPRWEVHRVDGLTTPTFTKDRIAEYPQLAAYMESADIPYSTEKDLDYFRHPRSILGGSMSASSGGASTPDLQLKGGWPFPDVSDDTLIQPNYIAQGRAAQLERAWKPKLGVEVVRYGDDETVIFRREGPLYRVHEGDFKQSTGTTTGHVIAARRSINSERNIREWTTIPVDSDGIGESVVDQLVAQNFDVFPFRNGKRASGPVRLLNRKSELYWAIREESRPVWSTSTQLTIDCWHRSALSSGVWTQRAALRSS